MTEVDSSVKRAVADYWDLNPCGAFASDDVQGERRFYEQVTSYRYATQPFMRRVIGFGSYPGRRVLEVGCGLGTDLLQFAKGGATAFGVDLSSRSISLADRHFRIFDTEGSFLQGDGENLPFSEGSFDVVYSFGVLHHVPDTQRAIDECYRVLKPGGQLILMLYNRRSWHSVVEPYLMAAKRWVLRQPLPPRLTDSTEVVRRYDGADNPLGKAYTKGEVKGMLERFTDRRFRICSARFSGRSWVETSYYRVLDWSGINRVWGFWIVAKARRPALHGRGG